MPLRTLRLREILDPHEIDNTPNSYQARHAKHAKEMIFSSRAWRLGVRSLHAGSSCFGNDFSQSPRNHGGCAPQAALIRPTHHLRHTYEERIRIPRGGTVCSRDAADEPPGTDSRRVPARDLRIRAALHVNTRPCRQPQRHHGGCAPQPANARPTITSSTRRKSGSACPETGPSAAGILQTSLQGRIHGGSRLGVCGSAPRSTPTRDHAARSNLVSHSPRHRRMISQRRRARREGIMSSAGSASPRDSTTNDYQCLRLRDAYDFGRSFFGSYNGL